MSDLRFDGRVVIVTGAGNGLGKSHALLFASRGAKVVVNDLGGGRHGDGKSSAAADQVVQEIKSAGGQAVANYDSVEDGAKIVQAAMDAFGQIDIVINNAGILRDTSFQKLTQEDWDLIYRVHVLGGFRVTHAAWNVTGGMKDKGYGRVIFTSSAAGIYGNFGQANYSFAKLGLVGLSNTLAIEGKKKNIHVNAIAPIAGSRLTETVLPKEITDALRPEYVSPLVAWLAHESCDETGGLFEVGGGFFAKLRWQRSEGKLLKLGRGIAPEQVKKAWKEIAGFEKVTYPADITSSMQPILGNLQSKSRGGNELIDVDAALEADLPAVEGAYDERDVALYALGIGAAENPADSQDLKLVYEMGDGFTTFPTFGVVPSLRMILDRAKNGEVFPGLNYGFDRILHGEQYTEVKRPLPPKAKLKHKIKIKDIFDKGKNATVVTAITSSDASTGEELVYNELTMLVRGAGGWGGDRGPQGDANVPPQRNPDKTYSEKTHENQALLYRLSGDINPLHVDPNFAAAFGFQKPILHGLCTFGFAARAVVKSFAPNGDSRYFKSIKVRFSDSVFPGETLVTEMWKESDTKIVFTTKVKERDKVVISNACVELYTEIPKPKPKAAAAAPAGAASTGGAAPTEPIAADIFNAIGAHFAANGDAIKKIGVVFQFKLTGPDATWTVDTKTASVSSGAGAAPECTLELSNENFMAMVTGKADAQKLYFGGQLKISGNVMASQKLEFLRKLDPNLVIAEMKKRGGGATASVTGPAASAPSGSGTLTSAHVFAAIKAHVEKNAAELTKIGVVYLFKLTNPDSSWTLDLKTGKLDAGETTKAECTLELADSDFMDMTSGKADPQKLYFGGKLKISGNVMASQKLGDIFKKMNPEDAKKAMASASAAAAPAPAAAAAAAAAKKEQNAPAIFAALGKRLGENKALGGELGGGTIQFTVDGKSWLVSAGGVKEGTDAKANAVLTISDEHLTALVKGQREVRDLHQRGELRVDGDIRMAHKLGMLKGLI